MFGVCRGIDASGRVRDRGRAGKTKLATAGEARSQEHEHAFVELELWFEQRVFQRSFP